MKQTVLVFFCFFLVVLDCPITRYFPFLTPIGACINFIHLMDAAIYHFSCNILMIIHIENRLLHEVSLTTSWWSLQVSHIHFEYDPKTVVLLA